MPFMILLESVRMFKSIGLTDSQFKAFVYHSEDDEGLPCFFPSVPPQKLFIYHISWMYLLESRSSGSSAAMKQT